MGQRKYGVKIKNKCKVVQMGVRLLLKMGTALLTYGSDFHGLQKSRTQFICYAVTFMLVQKVMIIKVMVITVIVIKVMIIKVIILKVVVIRIMVTKL